MAQLSIRLKPQAAQKQHGSERPTLVRGPAIVQILAAKSLWPPYGDVCKRSHGMMRTLAFCGSWATSCGWMPIGVKLEENSFPESQKSGSGNTLRLQCASAPLFDDTLYSKV
jgi:hypothetical protein